MCSEMKKNNNDLYGWVLVEAQICRRSGPDQVCLRGQSISRDGDPSEIFLPVLPSGRIHELIRLSDDVDSLTLKVSVKEQAQLQSAHIRRVGWFERTWRMANRVLHTFMRLSRQQRVLVGLSAGKVISCLPEAYRIVSRFRWGSSYVQWIECFDRLSSEDVRRIHRHISNIVHPPHFHLVLRADGAKPSAVQATLDSLKRQFYQNYTCAVVQLEGSGVAAADADTALDGVGSNSCVVPQQSAAAWFDKLNEALAEKQEWVMLLQPGDVLSTRSLYWFACEALARPGAAVLYSDDDALDAEGQRCQPRFKPDWSLAHARATNFIGNAAVLRGTEVAAAGGVSLDCCRHGNYDLLLRVVDAVGDAGASTVTHIPAVLMHCMRHAGISLGEEHGLAHPKKGPAQQQRRALEAHLERNRVLAEASKTLPDCWRIRYRLPEVPPLVSIIVPTRDEPAMVRQCVESVRSKTVYPRIEILVVDNQSADPEAQAYLMHIAGQDGIRVLRYDHTFNYSAINNFAVQQARGEVVCLLNNDTEVISPDWLEEMVGNLLQPRVGVVGAKLYFPDGRVQHAGDTVGPGGCANHLHSFIERNDPGYCNRAAVAQELSAVTGACLMVRKSLYEELGGLDEKHLPVAFNDVDLCLRVREAGYRVVWTPHAELYHHESISRGKDVSAEKVRWAKREVAYMRRRWKHVLRRDPFYNPNLSYERADFSISKAPLVVKPWQT